MILFWVVVWFGGLGCCVGGLFVCLMCCLLFIGRLLIVNCCFVGLVDVFCVWCLVILLGFVCIFAQILHG